MVKLVKAIIFSLSVCSLFLAGCSNKINENKSENNIESKVENSSDDINNGDVISSKNETEVEINSSNNDSNKDEIIDSSSNESNIGLSQDLESVENNESQKQMYLNKLNELDENLKETQDKKYSEKDIITTLDMLEIANFEYEQWDSMLNEIYSILEEQLSQEDMNKLRVEEIDWINAKELNSKEAADKYKGGTIAPYIALDSKINSTKERCYELVNKYMK